MRKQQEVWLKEHTDRTTLPAMAKIHPTSGVVKFIEWLRSRGVELTGNAVDIGSGKGRNSVYLASIGYEVWALEYIQPALEVAKVLADSRAVDSKVHLQLAEIDRPWQFDNEFFDIAIDSFSSIDVETRQGREVYRDEMYRTLKKGGYAMVSVVSAQDEWERELIAESPGPEPNSTIWPQSGKFQKDYDEAELRAFYNIFDIIEVQQIHKPAEKLGRQGTATDIWAVLRK